MHTTRAPTTTDCERTEQSGRERGKGSEGEEDRTKWESPSDRIRRHRQRIWSAVYNAAESTPICSSSDGAMPRGSSATCCACDGDASAPLPGSFDSSR